MSDENLLTKFRMAGIDIDVKDTEARGNISDIQAVQKNHEVNIENLQERMQATETDVSNLKNDSNNLSSEVQTITANVQTAQQNINALQSDLSEVKRDVLYNAGDIGGAQSNISTLNEKAVISVTLTNENGVYTLKEKRGAFDEETETEIGTIEVPQNNPIVETKDSVVENSTDGYDFHTFTETTSDGTEQELSKFYLSQKQILSISATSSGLQFKTVNQSGTVETQNIEISGGTSAGVSATYSETDGGLLIQ